MTDDTNDSPYLLPSQTITLTGGVVSKGRRGMTMTKTKSKWKTNKSSPLSENNFDWTMVALRQSIVYFGVRLCFIAFVSTMWILYCNSKNTDHNKRNVVALFFLADKAQVSSVRNVNNRTETAYGANISIPDIDIHIWVWLKNKIKHYSHQCIF